MQLSSEEREEINLFSDGSGHHRVSSSGSTAGGGGGDQLCYGHLGAWHHSLRDGGGF